MVVMVDLAVEVEEDVVEVDEGVEGEKVLYPQLKSWMLSLKHTTNKLVATVIIILYKFII